MRFLNNRIWLTALTLAFLAPAAAAERRGALCLTFDDFGGADWVKADKIFKKYDAHATFLISGLIDQDRIAVMKALQSAGHTVGLHGRNHLSASKLPEGWTAQMYFEKQVKPQLDVCKANNIKVVAFAYPNNQHNEASDKELYKYFSYLRAGGWGREYKPIYYPLNALPEKMILGGGGIGEYYKTDIAVIKKQLEEAHKSNSLVVYFSHNIFPGAGHIHMPSELLEELLAYARKLNMHIVGAAELKELRRKYSKTK